MKELSNPFVIGKYVSKEYFCDRKEEANLLVHHITNGRHVAIMSERRLGKTGLIEHVFANNLSKEYETSSSVQTAVKGLTEKGILSDSHGRKRPTDILFMLWLKSY